VSNSRRQAQSAATIALVNAGMLLAVCQQRHWPLNNYLQQPPVQQLIFGKVAELLWMPAEEFIRVHDDCGAPSDATWANGVLYAQLASGRNVDMERIVRATSSPGHGSGDKEFDTELML